MADPLSGYFVAIPEEALDLGGTPGACALLFAVYRRAHAARWRPFSASLSMLATESGLRRESLLRLLDKMEARGLIARDRGGRTEASTYTVTRPKRPAAQPGPQSHDNADHEPDHEPDHMGHADPKHDPPVPDADAAERTTTRTTERTSPPTQPGPLARAEEGTRAGEIRSEISTEERRKEDEIEKTRANAGDSSVVARDRPRAIRKTSEEAWQVQRCVALAGMSIVSGMSTMPPETTERIVAAVRSGWTDADFDLVWQWSTNSGDRMAELARESVGAARWSWLLAKQRENRRTEAKAWDARGRVDTPSAARSPPSGRAQKAGLNDLISFVDDQYFPGERL